MLADFCSAGAHNPVSSPPTTALSKEVLRSVTWTGEEVSFLMLLGCWHGNGSSPYGMFLLLNQQGALIIQSGKQAEGTTQNALCWGQSVPLGDQMFGVSLPHLYACSMPEKNRGWRMQPRQGRCLLRSSAEPLCMLQETQPGAAPPLLSAALRCLFLWDPSSELLASLEAIKGLKTYWVQKL